MLFLRSISVSFRESGEGRESEALTRVEVMTQG